MLIKIFLVDKFEFYFSGNVADGVALTFVINFFEILRSSSLRDPLFQIPLSRKPEVGARKYFRFVISTNDVFLIR